MKKVILLAMALFAIQTTFANETIIHGYPNASVGGHLITVDELCIDGEDVRTITPHTYCEKMSSGERGKCVRYKTEIYRSSKNVCHQECKKWKQRGDDVVCVKKVNVPYSFEQTYTVPVYKVVRDGIFKMIGSHEFNIPGCEELN